MFDAKKKSAVGLEIPYSRPFQSARELEYATAALRMGSTAAGGLYTQSAELELQKLTQSARCLLTTSCTHALELSALLLDLGPGDEVIVPSFTFVTTASAFALRGVTLRFADIQPDTLNIDPFHVQTLLNERTRAVVCVHYAGVACDLDALLALQKRADFHLIEDTAHGLFGRYHDRPLGSFGSMATLSFHATKNISCGEGGALLVNDAGLIQRAEILRDKGTNRSSFLRGDADRYTWIDTGSSFGLSDILAAVLLGQLEAANSNQLRRQQVWNGYRDQLTEWALQQRVQLPHVPSGCLQPAHIFYMVLPSVLLQKQFLSHMQSAGINAQFHYQPLNTTPQGMRLGGREGQCPVSESVAARLVRLPIFADLTQPTIDHVVDIVKRFQP